MSTFYLFLNSSKGHAQFRGISQYYLVPRHFSLERGALVTSLAFLPWLACHLILHIPWYHSTNCRYFSAVEKPSTFTALKFFNKFLDKNPKMTNPALCKTNLTWCFSWFKTAVIGLYLRWCHGLAKVGYIPCCSAMFFSSLLSKLQK